MVLSELKTGEEGIIQRVRGRGAFRRRMMEMGFIRGTKIKVIKNAPLKDPIEYGLKGYRISLRRSEAEFIEIDNRAQKKRTDETINGSIDRHSKRQSGVMGSRNIRVAFVGNPNAGKTSLFNFASRSSEHTGNYSGVTIDSKTVRIMQNRYLFNMTDLPGTYTLSALSQEELFVRNFIVRNVPDVVVNVIDASNLERNLYLTTQLIDMDIKVVIAFNMYDELEKRQDQINLSLFSKLLGIPVVPTVGSKGKGVKELFAKIIEVFNDQDPVQRHIHINYGPEIEKSIRNIQSLLKIPENYSITDRISSRFVALKLLDKDKHIENHFIKAVNKENILKRAAKEGDRLQQLFGEDAGTVITGKKYGFITGALRETFQKGDLGKHESTEILDSLLTHKVFGFPFFVFFMWLIFAGTFKLGSYPQHWIESGIGILGTWLSHVMEEGSLKDLLIDGIIGGVGGVLVFLPNILILFLFISFMEDSGYMARAVFIMDKLMHKIGLHGKSFIPLIMGFGCNVPAIMATRNIENQNNRLLTMLIIPFMSCSARLPVYLLLIGAIFPDMQGTLLFLLYFLGVLLAILMAILFRKTIFKSPGTPFVMELPPYRMPTFRSTIKHMWFKGSQYLKKMGGVILVASVLLWALGYYPHEIPKGDRIEADSKPTVQHQLEHSYIGKLGKFIEPAIKPLGFNWKMGVSLLSGIAAKEVVVSTLGVLHQVDSKKEKVESQLAEKLQNEKYETGDLKGENVFNPLSTLSFLLFTLIYFPCIAVFAAVKRESGNYLWALFMIFYTTVMAYTISLVVFQVGKLLIGM
jgi:ferrous iron transport protein B